MARVTGRILLALMLFAGVEAFGPAVTPVCEGLRTFFPFVECSTSGETCEGAGITGKCLPDSLSGTFACACCRDGPDLVFIGFPEIILPYCPS